MYSYKCVFNFSRIHKLNGEPHIVHYEEGIYAFAGGFWIDEDLHFTKGSDCKYWIPPSQILYIEKVRKDYLD